uniref:Uncharacterized protein n=1 Tax=Plectus sambesii TaxID=2011161 RepID=A0A914W6H8_9BILA
MDDDSTDTQITTTTTTTTTADRPPLFYVEIGAHAGKASIRTRRSHLIRDGDETGRTLRSACSYSAAVAAASSIDEGQRGRLAGAGPLAATTQRGADHQAVVVATVTFRRCHQWCGTIVAIVCTGGGDDSRAFWFI